MTGGELADETRRRLPPDLKKRLKPKDTRIIVRVLFEVITEAILNDDPVRIQHFGLIWAKFVPGGRIIYNVFIGRDTVERPRIELKFRACPGLKKRVRNLQSVLRAKFKKKMEAEMEKYGYEPKEQEELVKEANELGVCPKCGETLSGQPPVCPQCGSEPFEGQDEW